MKPDAPVTNAVFPRHAVIPRTCVLNYRQIGLPEPGRP